MLNEIALHRIIVGTMDGEEQALNQLFEYVRGHVAAADLSQLGPYGDDPDYRTEIALCALGRLLARRCRRLRIYLDEPELRFETLLSVVVARVVVDLARSLCKAARVRIERERAWLDIAAGESIGIVDQTVDESEQTSAPVQWMRARLGLYHFLSRTADPLDIKLARLAQRKPESWLTTARSCDISEASAHERVRRVHDRVRVLLCGLAPAAGSSPAGRVVDDRAR